MKKGRKSVFLMAIVAMCLVLALAACGGNNNNGGNTTGAGNTGNDPEPTTNSGNENAPEEEEEPREPVTITLGTNRDALFKEYIEPVLKEKHPHITLEYVNIDGKNQDELIVANQVPDMVLVPQIDGWVRREMLIDLSELIQSHNFDLGLFDEGMRQTLEYWEGYYALPFSRDPMVMVYNKDLFDRFSVDYPTDDMSWDEAFDLAEKFVRVEGQTEYEGLYIATDTWKDQLELRALNAEKTAADLSGDDWMTYAQLLVRYHSHPSWNEGGGDDFLKNQIMAMFFTRGSNVTSKITEYDALNWDFAMLPTFENGKSTSGIGNYIAISTSAKAPEDAFLVLETIYSTEVQKALAEDAVTLPFNNAPQEVKDSFGVNVPQLQGKNLAALYPANPAVKQVEEPVQDSVSWYTNKARAAIAEGGDINEAFREAEAKITRDLNEALAGGAEE